MLLAIMLLGITMKVVTPLQPFPLRLIFFASYLMSLKKKKRQTPDIYSTFNASFFLSGVANNNLFFC